MIYQRICSNEEGRYHNYDIYISLYASFDMDRNLLIEYDDEIIKVGYGYVLSNSHYIKKIIIEMLTKMDIFSLLEASEINIIGNLKNSQNVIFYGKIDESIINYFKINGNDYIMNWLSTNYEKSKKLFKK